MTDSALTAPYKHDMCCSKHRLSGHDIAVINTVLSKFHG